MNRRKIFTGISIFSQSGFMALLLFGALFLLGCFIGVFSSASVDADDSAVSLILSYLSVVDFDFDYFRVVFDLSKYLLAAFVIGFSLLGVILVPLLVFVRGFALAFAASVFIRVCGSDAILSVFLIFGIWALVSIPCFFIIAVQSFCASLRLGSAALRPDDNIRSSIYSKEYFIRLFLCVLLMFLLALVEMFVLRNLVSNILMIS